MSEENEVLEQPVKKKRILKAEAKPITGKMNSEGFLAAVDEIVKNSSLQREQVIDILVSTMQQAYLEYSYPGLFKDKDSEDPAKSLIKCEVVFSNSGSKWKIYDIKTVTLEDDIVDDAYQISLEDAQEKKPKAKVGDIIKVEYDTTQLDNTYVRRVSQLFQAKIKEASKGAILNAFQNQIGELITGTVARVDVENNTYELNFGKAQGFLKKNNKMPSDKFCLGDSVLVHLSDVSDKSNPPSLVISRTSKEFVAKLLERYVPEIAEGIVTIKAIEREPSKRTKVFVESNNKNVDAVGTCIGTESSRIRSVLNYLGNEKIDIVEYSLNKAVQIIEAMKPANVIGLNCPEDFFDSNVHYEEIENDRDYEYPKIIAVVNNGNQGVAIGSGGVNVRLASRITKCTISVLQADEAISSGTKYIMTNDILKNLGVEVSKPVIKNDDEEDDEEEEEIKDEEIIPLHKEDKVEEPVEDKTEVIDAVKAAKEDYEANVVNKQPVVEEEPVKEEVIEHIEIKNKPKISLEELESSMSKKKGPSVTTSKKKFKKNEETSTVISEASKVEAMPIYTEEELKAIEEDEDDVDEYEDDSEFDQYYSDEYYDEK